MTIIADTREPSKHPFPTEELDCGDYVITTENDGIIIERKEWTDLIDSLRSGKLYQQLRMCKEQEDYRVVLLIEGNRNNAIRYCKSSDYEIRRFLSSFVANSPEIQMVFTKTYTETVGLVKDLEDWIGDDKQRVHRIREAEKVPDDERARYLVEGLPQIGPKTAIVLIEHFGSAERVFTASKAELQEISGIGPKTAEGIREALS